jgi:hypothetical protein
MMGEMMMIIAGKSKWTEQASKRTHLIFGRLCGKHGKQQFAVAIALLRIGLEKFSEGRRSGLLEEGEEVVKSRVEEMGCSMRG